MKDRSDSLVAYRSSSEVIQGRLNPPIPPRLSPSQKIMHLHHVPTKAGEELKHVCILFLLPYRKQQRDQVANCKVMTG